MTSGCCINVELMLEKKALSIYLCSYYSLSIYSTNTYFYCFLSSLTDKLITQFQQSGLLAKLSRLQQESYCDATTWQSLVLCARLFCEWLHILCLNNIILQIEYITLVPNHYMTLEHLISFIPFSRGNQAVVARAGASPAPRPTQTLLWRRMEGP